MKKSNKIIIIVLISFSVFIMAHLSIPEQRIKRFVHQNHDELVTIAEAYLNSDTTTKTYKSVEVESVFRGDHDIVQFYYCGVGLVPSSIYYGFYYSPDDAPTAYCNVNYKLSAISHSKWEWTDGTDNVGYTRRITKNWFYYKARF